MPAPVDLAQDIAPAPVDVAQAIAPAPVESYQKSAGWKRRRRQNMATYNALVTERTLNGATVVIQGAKWIAS